jgi:hypothetical protein
MVLLLCGIGRNVVCKVVVRFFHIFANFFVYLLFDFADT